MTDAHSLDGPQSLDGGVCPESTSSESMARLSVSLPRSLYRQFRLHALEQDTTLSALIARLIRRELNARSESSC
jgi:hypothetical protein